MPREFFSHSSLLWLMAERQNEMIHLQLLLVVLHFLACCHCFPPGLHNVPSILKIATTSAYLVFLPEMEFFCSVLFFYV